jgi:hypothetical protein
MPPPRSADPRIVDSAHPRLDLDTCWYRIRSTTLIAARRLIAR